MMAATIYSDWRQLPFREIWVVDTEFYPGPGLANGDVEGDPLTPLCLCALEMRSGRLIRLWQDELGPFPPYRLDAEALLTGHLLSAEFGFHLARNWGEPVCALDTYIEFRHYTNDGTIKSGDRDKGFYGIGGGLRYFLEDELDIRRKEAMRDRIVQGPPFNAQERRDIQLYNEDDVQGGARLLRHIVPTIRSLPHALWRAKFQFAMARQERRGISLDKLTLARARQHWQGMKVDLISVLDQPFGCYEIVDGAAHWRKERFAELVRRNGMSWPRTENGVLDERDQTFRENGHPLSADRTIAGAALLGIEAAVQ